jgi:hypothetical protein
MVFNRSNGVYRSNGIATKIVVIIVLVVAVFAIGWGWNYGLVQERSYEQEAGEAHAAQTKNGCLQMVRGPLVKKADGEPCAPNEKAQQENDNRRDYVGLVAQRSSALWAKIMGIAALIGMGLSLVGVALVWTTFRETRKANTISSESMHRQLRAYITVDQAEHEQEDTEECVTLTINNSGATPATGIVVHSTMFDVVDGASNGILITTKAGDIGGQTKSHKKIKWYNWHDFLDAKLPMPNLISGKVTYFACVPNENGETVSFDVPFEFEPVSSYVSDKRMSLPGETYF